MCLIIFAIDSHPQFPLIVAANRDEFYARETLPMHRWDHPEGMLAGKDLEAGGTWLGVSEQRGIAMLTNYRDPFGIKPNAPTRGTLVSGYFHSSADAEGYLEQVSRESKKYNGFNLICGNHNGFFYYGNYAEGVRALSPGIHGLSNALINDPWPKVIKGKAELSQLIEKKETDPVAYLDMMFDPEIAEDTALPETGVGKDKERMLSPMFIRSPAYGSRSSTVILVSSGGDATVVERSYLKEASAFTDREFTFQW